ncbi:NERD domain-containing protein [Opitutus terrae]|uniref:NERD domain-containing protein n=1 Tax=Opitutus terrae (strain DSM 11246 / JCM 15787 / PB90-1) TaxID=452637 RepID=B1ZMH3_OPITP|nr:NERD domain-containing protein [Opitutus terrae]ACB74318.1 hypothetical protein Oter_1030 [Opitutus terrae PB90-1]
MNPMPDTKIELYASGAAGETAEVAFFRELVARLKATGRKALVVCQPKLPRCTPDFFVATEFGAWTVDVKTIGGSLHGSRRDAEWRIRIRGVKAKRYPNLLTKMKQQREALLDDMRDAAKTIGAPVHNIKDHVAAVAAVWPKLPDGSACDRKPDQFGGYSVCDGDEAIRTITIGTLKVGWPLDLWRRFVLEHLRAVPVRTVDELCDPTLFEAVRCAEAYREEFVRCFRSQGGAFAPHRSFFEELRARVAVDGALLVHGASGLGKTAHLEACALELARAGTLPVFASAEVYDGSLEKLQEVGSAGYAPTSIKELLSHLPRLTAQRRILFVDGVDSVAEELRRTLISQIADQMDRGLWSLVVLSAKIENPDVDARLPLGKLAAPAMEGAHREAVFQAHRRPTGRTQWQERLLEVASDGFAVRALALADGVPDGSSLAEAIGSYVRSLLPQDQALVAAQISRVVAAAMENRFAQSLAVTEFDQIAAEVCRKEGAGLTLGDSVRRSRLFRQQGDRIRFQHERLQVFLAAQALDEGTADTAALLSLLIQARNRQYTRSVVGFPQRRTLVFFIAAWSLLEDDGLVPALVAGEFGVELRAAGVQAVREFLDRYCTYLGSHPQAIVFKERGEGIKPQPVLAADNAFFPSQPEEKFALRMLRCAEVVRTFTERIADVVLLEEQSLLRAAHPHAQTLRGRLQIVRKVVAADGIWAKEPMLLLRNFHQEWNQRLDDPLLEAIACIPTRGGTMMEIISLQAKLAASLEADEATAVLARWVALMDQSGFKAGRVFERYSDRMLFQNWDVLVEAHRNGGEFKVLLEKLVNEGLDTKILWDDTLLRFGAEIGVIDQESMESQTERILAGLRANSESWGENDLGVIASGKRHLFDRAVEFNEWEAWTEAWSKLSGVEKRAFAHDAIPSAGVEHSGMFESMLIGFLASEACIEPEDLIGVFRTLPWDGVMFGIGDAAACQMELATHWGIAGRPLPADAFRHTDYSEGDAAAWPVFVSLIHAVAGAEVGKAKALLTRLITEHPLVLPALLAAMMERRHDNHPLKKVAADILREFRMELARVAADACGRMEELRCVICPKHFPKARTVALIFQLCVDGNAETRAAVERHVDSPHYGQIAVAAMRAGAV